MLKLVEVYTSLEIMSYAASSFPFTFMQHEEKPTPSLTLTSFFLKSGLIFLLPQNNLLQKMTSQNYHRVSLFAYSKISPWNHKLLIGLVLQMFRGESQLAYCQALTA